MEGTCRRSRLFLATMYSRGQGVRQDLIESYAWLSLNVADDTIDKKLFEDSLSYKLSLEAGFTPAQKAQAIQRFQSLKTGMR